VSLETLKDVVKDYGRDIRINLDSVLSVEGAPGLSSVQIFGTFLAGAFASKSPKLIQIAGEIASEKIDEAEIEGVRAAATIMGMNNIYYRYLHLLEGEEDLKKLPAKLRMQVIARPGIEKVNFEIYSLAVSAITGCGMCINAHVQELKKHGVSDEGIQSVIRIAAVTHGAAQALVIS
jgi:alkyl hydroperoxide reductase subunit D